MWIFIIVVIIIIVFLLYLFVSLLLIYLNGDQFFQKKWDSVQKKQNVMILKIIETLTI